MGQGDRCAHSALGDKGASASRPIASSRVPRLEQREDLPHAVQARNLPIKPQAITPGGT